MLILSKKRKFRIFQLFFTHMTLNDFLHQHKSTKFDTGFRMVHKLSYLEEKKFLSIFSIRGDPYQKKIKTFFFYCNDRSKYYQNHPKHVILHIFQFSGPNIEKKLKSETFLKRSKNRFFRKNRISRPRRDVFLH